jgi:hypothetical protein
LKKACEIKSCCSHGRVGPAFREYTGFFGQEGPVFFDAAPDIIEHRCPPFCSRELYLSGEHDFDRLTELHGEDRAAKLGRIQLEFTPETSSGIPGDHPHIVLSQFQYLGQQDFYVIVRLGRGVHSHFAFRCVIGHGAVSFHAHMGLGRAPEPVFPNIIRFFKSLIHIAPFDMTGDVDISFGMVMKLWCPFFNGFQRFERSA